MNLWSDEMSATVRLWSLSDDVLVEDDTDPDSLTVITRWGETTVTGSGLLAAESLRRMGFGPVTLRNTVPPAVGADGREQVSDAMAALVSVLEQLRGVVVHSLALPDGQGPVLSVAPLTVAPAFDLRASDPSRRVRLSRFAVLRPMGADMTLEVPSADFQVLLHRPPAMALVTALVTAFTPAELAAAAQIAPPVVTDLLSFLVAAGVVVVADASGAFAEDRDPALRGWSPHELVFHGYNRSQRADRVPDPGSGDGVVPAPVIRPRPAGERIALYRPDIDELAVTDPTLTTLLESDHTCPHITDDQWLTFEQVGELLFRSARVRSLGRAHMPTVPDGVGHDASQRPYFNIACLYELEVYLTVNRAAGLARGAYHYDPLEHALTRIETGDDDVEALLDIGMMGAGSTRQPAALLTITLRIGRIAWMVPGGAYAIALRHCGALQETLYLVSRAMGITAHVVPGDAAGGVDRLLRLPGAGEVGIGECIIEPARCA